MGPLAILPLFGLAVFAACYGLSAIVGEKPRWWLIRLGLVPFLCLGVATYVILVPTPKPPSYDPAIHGNLARLDFIAAMFYGAALPAVYLAGALPTFVVLALLKRRKGSAS